MREIRTLVAEYCFQVLIVKHYRHNGNSGQLPLMDVRKASDRIFFIPVTTIPFTREVVIRKKIDHAEG
jgi:hypothetical protein